MANALIEVKKWKREGIYTEDSCLVARNGCKWEMWLCVSILSGERSYKLVKEKWISDNWKVQRSLGKLLLYVFKRIDEKVPWWED